MISNFDKKGVSPILAILLLIAITLMVAGIVTLWTFSFLNEEHDTNSLFVFDVEITSSTDTILITQISGKIVNTSYFKFKIGDQQLNLTTGVFKAGEAMQINPGFDIIQYETYHIKIIYNNKMIYDREIIAT
ncbi:MAG: type IV pilin [Candidatus Thermoplasmatota archaeon]|jgi:flagellin-like protein|nr:type IV pilin [Candidatus Thermoplasmatota archaeon]